MYLSHCEVREHLGGTFSFEKSSLIGNNDNNDCHLLITNDDNSNHNNSSNNGNNNNSNDDNINNNNEDVNDNNNYYNNNDHDDINNDDDNNNQNNYDNNSIINNNLINRSNINFNIKNVKEILGDGELNKNLIDQPQGNNQISNLLHLPHKQVRSDIEINTNYQEESSNYNNRKDFGYRDEMKNVNDHEKRDENNNRNDYEIDNKKENENECKNVNQNSIRMNTSSEFTNLNLFSSDSNTPTLILEKFQLFHPNKSIFVKKCIGDEEASNSLKQYTWIERSSDHEEDSSTNLLPIIISNNTIKNKRKREETIPNKKVNKNENESEIVKKNGNINKIDEYEKVICTDLNDKITFSTYDDMKNNRLVENVNIKNELEIAGDGKEFSQEESRKIDSMLDWKSSILKNVPQSRFIKNEIE